MKQENFVENIPGILLLSHGPFCQALLESAQMIGGEAVNVVALPLLENASIDEYGEKAMQTFKQMPEGSIVLFDLASGTPFNQMMMKSGVLDTFDTIKACVAYKVDGEEIDYFPYDITEGVEPVYAELPGWKTDMTKMQSEDEFPEEFNAYLTFLEEQLGVEIKIVSVGPDRAQTIERYTEE